MARDFCNYKGTHYPTNAKVCMDGYWAVCMPDGNWDNSATPCAEQTQVTVSNAPKLTATAADVDHLVSFSANVHSLLFPDDVILSAQEAQKQTGCLASVTLAQWALESGYGKYQLHANNPFGIKWYDGCGYGYVVVHTKEFEKGKWIVVSAKFIAFPSIQAAFSLHGQMLMDPNGPFSKSLPFKNDWQKYIEAIAPIYATDPHYAQSLTSIVQRYSLNSFDLPT